MPGLLFRSSLVVLPAVLGIGVVAASNLAPVTRCGAVSASGTASSGPGPSYVRLPEAAGSQPTIGMPQPRATASADVPGSAGLPGHPEADPPAQEDPFAG